MRAMTSHAEKAAQFLALHHTDGVLLLPNAHDAGTAKIFEAMGFAATATTSAGFAGTLGRRDYQVTRDEALEHCAALVAATNQPVIADYEKPFSDAPAYAANKNEHAAATGLAGCSIEDATGRADEPIYDIGLAKERVAAAAEAAHAGPAHLVHTARAENFLHGVADLDDTIARLRAYQEAGADVLYAPGMYGADVVRTIVESVDRPVNVLALPGTPSIAELAELGVKRVSLGSALAMVALAAVVDAATEFRDQGTYGFWATTGSASVARDAFSG
jgi:2-methylisocitrate lyase-like PEP mutase family enzyme